MSFNDVSKNFFDGLKSRYVDPFVGTFSASFLTWNYQIIIYAFSDYQGAIKYKLIHESFNPGSFLIPILMTWLILIGLPKFFIKIYHEYEGSKTELENIRYKAAKNLIPIASQLESLNSRIASELEKNSELTKKISEKDQEIGSLKAQHLEQSVQLAAAEKKIAFNEDLIRDNEHELSGLRVELKDAREAVKRSQSLEPSKLSPMDSLIKIKALDVFEDVAARVETGKIVRPDSLDNKVLVKLLALGLVRINNSEFGHKSVRLTELGRQTANEIVQTSIS